MRAAGWCERGAAPHTLGLVRPLTLQTLEDRRWCCQCNVAKDTVCTHVYKKKWQKFRLTPPTTELKVGGPMAVGVWDTESSLKPYCLKLAYLVRNRKMWLSLEKPAKCQANERTPTTHEMSAFVTLLLLSTLFIHSTTAVMSRDVTPGLFCAGEPATV